MWTKSTVDEILRNGDAMYLNTAFDADPETLPLTHLNVQ